MGPELTLPSSLEPDTPIEGLLSIGASQTSVSAWGVERYEEAAYLVAEQAIENPDLFGCTPSGPSDIECAEYFIDDLGRRAWRRPLGAEELDALVELHQAVASDSDSFETGAVYAIAAVLQSPHFLYRVEIGEPDPERPGQRLLTDYEIATRLAFFLWNTLPDEELLLAAEAGELSTTEGPGRVHALRRTGPSGRTEPLRRALRALPARGHGQGSDHLRDGQPGARGRRPRGDLADRGDPGLRGG